jgi:hypothetical protein
VESHESPATLLVHISSSGRLASASKLYLGTLPTPKFLPNEILEIQLGILHILVSSLSYPGGLPYSSPRSGLDFFVRNVFYHYLLEPLIHGTHSQRSLGVILTLFSLTIEVLITQMPAAFNPISSRSLDSYQFQLQNPSCLVGSAFTQ